MSSESTVRQRGQPLFQVVDPGVTRTKFDRELASFERHRADFQRQGCLLLHAAFPCVSLLFTAPKMFPAAVLFEAEFDFTNYDVDPVSVRLLSPWTGSLLRMSELPSKLPKPIVAVTPATVDSTTAAPEGAGNVQFALLAQAWLPPNDIPFLCIRGVREYHRHPAHTGDSWLMYRGRGEGSLIAVVSQLLTHSSNAILGYSVQVQFKGFVPSPGVLMEQIVTRVDGLAHVFGDKIIVTPF
jgi:hypothetical protein